jgi:hypothetical protein
MHFRIAISVSFVARRVKDLAHLPMTAAAAMWTMGTGKRTVLMTVKPQLASGVDHAVALEG